MLERKVAPSGPAAGASTKEPCAKKMSSPRKVSYTVSTEAFSGSVVRRGSLAKMPPPPPKQGEWSGGAGVVGAAASLDSLARLYETAKQLDGDEEEEQPIKHGRERAVSDAEVFQYKTEQENSGIDSMEDDQQPVLRRERSASCGTVPSPMRKRNSRSQLSCETIEEEPESKSMFDRVVD